MALQRIDMLLCPAVEGPSLTAPPAGPTAGACYLVGIGATGAWAGQDGAIASFTAGGWRFVAPVEGVHVFDRMSGQMVARRNDNWEAGVVRAGEIRIDDLTVLREQQPAIAGPDGGSVVDSQCRTAVAAILSAMRNHGLIA